MEEGREKQLAGAAHTKHGVKAGKQKVDFAGVEIRHKLEGRL